MPLGHGDLDFWPSGIKGVWRVQLIQVNTHLKLESFGWKHIHFMAKVDLEVGVAGTANQDK